MVTDVQGGQNPYPVFQVMEKVYGLAVRKHFLN